MPAIRKTLAARSLWLKIHLYLGLILGLFFAVLGLTGSVALYWEELDEWLNPELVIAHPGADYQSLDTIMAAVRAEHPNRLGAWSLEMPRTPHSTMTAWFDKPRETFFEYYAPLMVSVNPYTAKVITSRFWGQTAMTWVLDLHTQLHLDRLGWQIVGGLGFLLMVSVMSGLYLWWPGRKNLRKAFRIRFTAGVMPLVMDSHRLLGFISAGALLVLAFTGFQLSFPEILESLTESTAMTHGNNGPSIRSSARPNNRPIGLEDAEFIARGAFPKSSLRRITTPVGETGTYRVNLRQSSELNQKHPLSMVWIDRWSGHMREVQDPAEFSWGENFAASMWPVHTGEALGRGGKRLWFAAGLMPALFYLSGFAYWLYRHGKIRNRQIDYVAMDAKLRLAILRILHLAERLARWLWKHAQQHGPVVKAESERLYALCRQFLFRLTK